MDSAEQQTRDIKFETAPRHMVVGIGASAGGLRALEEFFASIPPDTGCSFVVVQHLSPDFESVMDTLLGRQTDMTIQVIETGMRLEPDQVYLNPPRMNVEIHGGAFVLSRLETGSLHFPINVLFQSLAIEYGSNAVAIVMSGTGSDGTKGLGAVHRGMGMLLVQSLDSAEFDGMPKNAIATGLAHHVVSPMEMARLVSQHAESPNDKLGIPPDGIELQDLEGMNEVQVIFSLLMKEYGIDFSHYKPGTVARRIDRRLKLSRYGGLGHYTDELKENPDELSLLYHDLLIGVTSFFRDPDSFRSLTMELLPTVQSATAENPLRIWCAGCASGEEAYSLAIMLFETFIEHDLTPYFKVFATDVHDRTLDVAAQGIYPNDILDCLTQSQRKQYFTSHSDSHSRVLPRLRSHLVFAKQNIVSDPPFSKMNLVICRNLLIYLQDEAQAVAISGFRYALIEDGLLMLGPSETLGRFASGFETIDKTWRLFRKGRRTVAGVRTSESFKRRGIINPLSRTFKLVDAESRTSRVPEISHLLLSDLLPAAILLDVNNDILEVFGSVTEYLQATSYKIRGNLLDFFDSETKSTLFAILTQAHAAEGEQVAAFDATLATPLRSCQADIFAKAFSVSSGKDAVVLLRFQSPAKQVEWQSETPVVPCTDESVRELKRELDRTRMMLGSTIQDLESANQDLQSANEEMIVSNVELETTNEELQSVNEELKIVNFEHQRKVEELEELTDDLDNLFDSTNVGLILLDNEMQIRKVSSAARRHFNLMEHDVGRVLDTFASQISIDNFYPRVREVMRTGNRFKTRARDRDNNLVSVDVAPYFANKKICGVMINIVDVVVLQPDDSDQAP